MGEGRRMKMKRSRPRIKQAVKASLHGETFSATAAMYLASVTPEALADEHDALFDIVNTIRDNPEEFPQWHSSATANLYAPCCLLRMLSLRISSTPSCICSNMTDVRSLCILWAHSLSSYASFSVST